MERQFFFNSFTRFLPFYPTTEPGPRPIKRCFKNGATGESTSSIGGGGGGGWGVNGHQRYDYPGLRKENLCYSVGD